MSDAIAPETKSEITRTEGQPTMPALLSGLHVPLFTFNYSYREYSRHGDRTHIKASDCRYDGTRLIREDCEAVAGPEAFSSALEQAASQIGEMQAHVLKLWQPWLIWGTAARKRDESSD